MSYAILHDRDIIMISLKPWDNETGSCCRQYAKVFADNHNRVLFVNRALDRVSRIKFRNDPKIKKRMESLRDEEKSLQQVQPNIWVLDPPVVLESINKIPFPGLFDRLNMVNNRRLAGPINHAADKLGFRNTILFIENEFLRAFYLKEMIPTVAQTVYYLRDYLPSQDYFKKHGKRLEPLLLKKMDVVIANSQKLMEYALEYNPNSSFVGQGCDLDIFSDREYERPADMKAIPSPIIGYTGAILATRMDINLIRRIAAHRKEWSVVLVGPEDDEFRKSDLHGFSNIHFLGRKKIAELPGYISHFDICMNPQLVNEMTIGNYPLKIDEYLAMGKPVVATRTPAMEMFKDFVELGQRPEDYLANIEALLSNPPDVGMSGRRKAFAGSHTWESCVTKLDALLAHHSSTVVQ